MAPDGCTTSPTGRGEWLLARSVQVEPMNRASYLDDPSVDDFLEWMAPLVSGDRPLQHRWDRPMTDATRPPC